MLPSSTQQRKAWPKIGHTDSRGTEIQRLIGRSLRAAIDLSKIGPHTIALDCQVLQADGGTRTAAIRSFHWWHATWHALQDRKSTRLNSSHRCISYAVFCLKKKKKNK